MHRKSLITLLIFLIPGFGNGQISKLVEYESWFGTSHFHVGNRILIVSDSRVIECDGTPAGTRELGSFNLPQMYLNTGSYVYFFTYDQESDYHVLQKYDPADASIVTLKKVNKYNQANVIRVATTSDGIIYFFAVNETGDVVLWKSDGTVSGTATMPVSIGDLSLTSHPQPVRMDVVGETLVVSKSLGGTSNELWSIDLNSFAATKLIDSSVDNFTATEYNGRAVLDGIMYFSGHNSTYGTELWQTDGTVEGTRMVRDLMEGQWDFSNVAKSSNPENFRLAENQVFFTTENEQKLWAVNLSQEITLVDSCEGGGSLCFSNLTAFGAKIVFNRRTTYEGKEPWISNGTPGGTKLAGDVWRGIAGSTASVSGTSFYIAGEKAFFLADDGVSGRELWYVEYSSGQTKKALEITPGPGSSSVTFVKSLNDVLVFTVGSNASESLFTVPLSQLTSENPAITSRIPSPYWFQTIGPDIPLNADNYLSFNYDMAITPDDDIILTGVFDGNRLSYYDNAYVSPFLSPEPKGFVCKFNEQGELLWNKVTSTTELYYRNHAFVAADTKGNVLYGTSFYPNSRFYDLTPGAESYSAYIAKFNAAGNQLWLRGATSSSGVRLNNIETDDDDNVFVAGKYAGPGYEFGNAGLVSDHASTYFVQKLDADGHPLWAKNIDDASGFGEITDMEIDEGRNRILLLFSEGTRNTASSCAFQNWSFWILCLDFSGNVVWRKEFMASDLTIASSLAVTNNGDILAVGRFRGKLVIDAETLITDNTDYCNVSTSFLVRLDKNGKLISAVSDNPNDTDAYDVQFFSDGSYLVSGILRNTEPKPYPGYDRPYPNGRTQVFMRKYDFAGNLISERMFNKTGSDFQESLPIIRIDHQGDIVFSDRSATKYDSVTYSVSTGWASNVILLKTNLDGFVNLVNPENIAETIQIFPNPAEDRLYVKIWKDEPQAQSWQLSVYDIKGNRMVQTILPDSHDVFHFQAATLPDGLYLFKFANGSKNHVRRVIIRKQP